MFGILVSALNVALGFLVRGVIVKFGIMFAAWYLVLELVSALVSYVPGSASITAALSAFPPSLWYFLDLMRLDIGIPLMLAAFTTRFLIRRIPFVG
jgi:hypothetical protein